MNMIKRFCIVLLCVFAALSTVYALEEEPIDAMAYIPVAAEDDPTVVARVADAEQLWLERHQWEALALFRTLPLDEMSEELRMTVEAAILRGESWKITFFIYRITFLLIVASISFGMFLAMRGVELPLRFIPGVDAIREAVGRSTEMGRPSLFCIGVSDMHHPETFAAMPFLRKIAQTSAQLRNRLLIPVCSERTLTLQQMTYREACHSIGEARAYHPSDVRFFPGGLFYFAVATMGYMLRERPAACFFFGNFAAESLMLSETGQVVGAMQIAGTSQLFQVPFFIASCDYVIIGEEFFAASATLSHNPVLRGSLFGQDLAKLALLLIIAAGTIGLSVAAWVEPVRAFVSLLLR